MAGTAMALIKSTAQACLVKSIAAPSAWFLFLSPRHYAPTRLGAIRHNGVI
jgi:hypothetical protein